MDSDDLANALSALSLMLGIVAVLFGMWQPIAAAALAIEPKRHRASRNGQITEIRSARLKMGLLAVISSIVAGVFFARSVGIVASAAMERGAYYDLSTALVVAEALMLALAGYVWTLTAALHSKCRRLDANVEIDPTG